jgi:spore coat protein A
MNRRDFLIVTAGTASMLTFRGRARASSPSLTKFKDTLPGLTSAGSNNLGQYIPVARANSVTRYGEKVDFFQINMVQHTEKMHSDLPPTTLWGYDDASGPSNPHYLGPAIVGTAGTPAVIDYINSLPGTHPLPVDTTLMGADGPVNRVSPHLHGGFVSWESDGGPFAWFTSNRKLQGPSLATNQFWYPNQQSARLMWYHDHALGITRLNAYAGLAAPYVLTDSFEAGLVASNLVPNPVGIPLIIQDKSFQSDGRLAYPSVYDADYGPVDGDPPAVVKYNALPFPSCVPEFFGDTTVVNGTCFPKLTLRPGVYRFRILNGSQARFYNLNLFYATGSGAVADLSKAGPAIVQIGTEGGFLPAPVVLNQPPQLMAFDRKGNPTRYNLLLAPAERADILIDLKSVPAGSKLIFYNDAPAPFPGGDSSTDVIGDTKGPDTRHLLRIDIEGPPISQPSIDLNKLGAALASRFTASDLAFATPGVVRQLTLSEDFDDYGRLIQRLGTDVSLGKNNQGLITFARDFMQTPTETPRVGDIETWQIFNLTGDTHPIHVHLVNMHVVSRQAFDIGSFPKVKVTGPTRGPDANERGWKETVRMNPGEVTTVAMKFDLPVVPYTVPFSPRLQSDYKIMGGREYVWHCHILEHEEHDMMRPLVVL